MKNREHIDAIVAHYQENTETYTELGERYRELLEQLVGTQHIDIHSIACRSKALSSLRKKLERSNRQYGSLTEVTDLAGVRVITWYADDVDKVGGLVESEFSIDRANSVDKRKLLDPATFGYMSLHYVCSLHPKREGLPEYQSLAGLKCEIQVRSILQHAWAEIEHDLGYKQPEAVPQHILRRFSRLAALLEVGDDEFIRIRDELAAYQTEIAGRVLDQRQTIAIDKISLTALIQEDPLIRRIDERAAAEMGAYLLPPDGDSVEQMVVNLRHIGVQTAAQLRQEVAPLEYILVLAIQRFIDTMKPQSVKEFPLYRGVSISHLWHVWLVTHGQEELIVEHLAAQGIPEVAIDLISRQIVGATKLALDELAGNR